LPSVIRQAARRSAWRGLDPQSRLFMRERVRDLRSRGVTVVLTTHDMDEAAEMADRVGIVDHGKLLALNTPEGLTRSIAGHAVLDLSVTPADGDDPEKLIVALTDVAGVERGEAVAGGPLRLYLTADPATVLAPVIAVLSGRSATLTDVHMGTGSLEDVFIDLTGRGLR
jgi:ABC-2 type transport system ATP-binding protein